MTEAEEDKQRLYEASFATSTEQVAFRQQLKEFQGADRFALVLVSDWLRSGQHRGTREVEYDPEHLERLLAAYLAINLALMFDGRRTLKSVILRALPDGFEDSAAVFGTMNYLNALCAGGFADIKNFPNWISRMGLERDIDFGRTFLERYYKFILATGQNYDTSYTLSKAEVFIDLSTVIDEYITLAGTRYFENPLAKWQLRVDDKPVPAGTVRRFDLVPPEPQRAPHDGVRRAGGDAALVLCAGRLDRDTIDRLEASVGRGPKLRGLVLDLGDASNAEQLSFLVSVFQVLADALRRQA